MRSLELVEPLTSSRSFADAHHLLFHRQEWSLRSESRSIREHYSLIPVIERDVHDALHRVAPAVPLLGYHALLRVRAAWQPDANTFRSVSNLQSAMETAARNERSHQVESDLARLAIHALDIQVAFLKGNIVGQQQ